jgi:hypothetical protein
MDIVIDFDGTVVTHEFPKVGVEIGAVPVLKELVANGHNLILFTMRSDVVEPYSKSPEIVTTSGNYLTDAINWFKEREIPLYGVQRNPTQDSWTSSPKAYGQIIIDDAALGCPLIYSSVNGNVQRPYVDWQAVRSHLQMLGCVHA